MTACRRGNGGWRPCNRPLLPEQRPLKHAYAGKDLRMAIDPGLGSLTYATEDGTIAKVQIAPSADTDHRAVRKLQRAMERSRQATNPDNYETVEVVRHGKKHKSLKVKPEKASPSASSGGSDGGGFRPLPYKGCVSKDFVVGVTANRGQPRGEEPQLYRNPSTSVVRLFRYRSPLLSSDDGRGLRRANGCP